MPVLPQLKDPQRYRPCDWDLARDAAGRAYWVERFCQQAEYLSALVAEEYPNAEGEQQRAFARDYAAEIERVGRSPGAWPRVDILLLTQIRQQAQDRYGFPDPFERIKASETLLALELLPGWLAEVDAAPAHEVWRLLAEGLMAGNVFDLGSAATLERFQAGQAGFAVSRAGLKARPWFVDGLDAWAAKRRELEAHRHAMFFVDNAGSDIVLGCLPFARQLLREGTRVTLAANSGPALNDVTAGELRALLGEVSRHDWSLAGAIADGRLSVVGSGNDLPLLDLTDLSEACVAAAEDVDLVILHGMGRAVESNRLAEFGCDVLRTAMIKDAGVARHVGAELFDCVFRYKRYGL